MRVVPRTDKVPVVETPSADTLIVVNPTRRGLTTPPLSTVAIVESALSQVSAVAETAAPVESVACTAIGVNAPTAVGVIAGNDSAVTFAAGAGGAGGVTAGVCTTAEAGAEAAASGVLAASSLLPPQPDTHTRTSSAKRGNRVMVSRRENSPRIFVAIAGIRVTKRA